MFYPIPYRMVDAMCTAFVLKWGTIRHYGISKATGYDVKKISNAFEFHYSFQGSRYMNDIRFVPEERDHTENQRVQRKRLRELNIIVNNL